MRKWATFINSSMGSIQRGKVRSKRSVLNEEGMANAAIFINSSQDSAVRDKTRSKRSVLNEEGMAKRLISRQSSPSKKIDMAKPQLVDALTNL